MQNMNNIEAFAGTCKYSRINFLLSSVINVNIYCPHRILKRASQEENNPPCISVVNFRKYGAKWSKG